MTWEDLEARFNSFFIQGLASLLEPVANQEDQRSFGPAMLGVLVGTRILDQNIFGKVLAPSEPLLRLLTEGSKP